MQTTLFITPYSLLPYPAVIKSMLPYAQAFGLTHPHMLPGADLLFAKSFCLKKSKNSDSLDLAPTPLNAVVLLGQAKST